jgi:peptidoglycan/xylan/chitin deacetylase (PgdA/CDA1 family)
VIARSALALASRGRLSILIFHRVLAERDPLLPGEPTAADLDALLAHLTKRFTILPLGDAVRRLTSATLPRAALAITFDDGYADNLAVAAPLLRKHGVPATVFIATGYLDGGSMWNDAVIAAFHSARLQALDLECVGLRRYALGSIDERRAAIDLVLDALKYRPAAQRERDARAILQVAGGRLPDDLMLTSDGVRSLAKFGIDIGAHTVTHPILAKTPAADAWREICDSKRSLEQLLDHDVKLFAYPNGRPGDDYTAEHVKMVQDAGFDAAVSTAWGAAGRHSDRMQLPRFTPWTRKPFRFDLLMLRNLGQIPRQEPAICG